MPLIQICGASILLRPSANAQIQKQPPDRHPDLARRAISAAQRKAVEIGQPVGIWAVDSRGNLAAPVAMDCARFESVNIAITKTWTRAFDISTKELAEQSQSSDRCLQIHVFHHRPVMTFAGGFPLKRGSDIVGAIGVSGGMGQQNHAEAAAEAF